VSEPEVRLEPLHDATEGPALGLPSEIDASYGGPFRLGERIVYGNFVTSVDGIAALAGVPMSSATISGGAPADRFVMALLRAVADAVVVGAGTLREHGGPWTAERAFPSGADRFREARAALGGAPAPRLVVVTASGELPADHPALPDAVVVTTASGARAMSGRGVRCREVVETGDGDGVDGRAAIARLRDRGFERILTEGGPRLMGSLLEAGVVDELFLTVSPKLLGGGEGRPPLTDGVPLDSSLRLLSARHTTDYLFLRYAIGSATAR
jgi:riboflavin biosynthesis pyrimidine reductase